MITVCVGECGVNLCADIWEQYVLEHGLDEKGLITNESEQLQSKIHSFFHESKADCNYTPRTIMIDTEPDIIENILQTSKYNDLLKHTAYGKQDSGNNFARCYYGIDEVLKNDIIDKLRKLTEDCDRFNGFIMNSSIAGGTGSGLSALLPTLMEDNSINIATYIQFHVYPFRNNHSECCVDIYNSVFAASSQPMYTPSITLDNQQIYKLCQNQLDIASPSFKDINGLIVKAQSCFTEHLRFEQKQQTLHKIVNRYGSNRFFPLMSPLINSVEDKKQILCDGFIRKYYPLNYLDIYQDVLNIIYQHYNISNTKKPNNVDPVSMLKHCLDFEKSSFMEYSMRLFDDNDHEECFWKYWDSQMIVSAMYHFRGKTVSQKDLDFCKKSILDSFGSKDESFYIFDRYNLGHLGDSFMHFTKNNEVPLVVKNNDVLRKCQFENECFCTVFCDSQQIWDFMQQNLLNPFQKMLDQKAFLHHYTKQGMELDVINEMFENLNISVGMCYDLQYIGQTDDEDYSSE